MRCSTPTRIMWDPDLIGYNFGRGHPLAPVRVDLTMRLAREFGILDRPDVTVTAAVAAQEKTLRLLHEAPYLAAVQRAGTDPRAVDLYRGLGTGDNPTFHGMYEASALVAGQSVAAAEVVWRGEVGHSVNIAGGLHHALAGAASGFCVFNDVALGIARLLELGAERVAYVDVDVHHGDGVQALFWDDPRVLTISLHESGRTLFPGTGFPHETGGPGALGTAVNVALPAGTGDAGWLRAFEAVVPPLLRAFAPQVLVTQHGCDTHAEDPLAHLTMTVDGQRRSYARLHELAHEVCDGRWMATGGGGYALVDVVPRSWTHLLAELTGDPLDPTLETAADWQAHVSSLGATPPRRMTDGADAAFAEWDAPGVDDAVDDAVRATRQAVFGHHGLDPNRAA
ncbi:MAG TPA: acetoin utilization protein AcuC [Sporichthyaceae bacterium]|nr:acetoin utilization protein AcuC [Sporichthyaceae bacterium]